MPLSGLSLQRHQVQRAKPLTGRRDAVLVDAGEGRQPPPAEIRRACPPRLSPRLTRPGMQRQHREQRGDDPTSAPGPWFPPEFGQKSRSDEPRGEPPVPSPYACRSASLNAHPIGGVSLMRSPYTFERLEERVHGAIAPARCLQAVVLHDGYRRRSHPEAWTTAWTPPRDRGSCKRSRQTCGSSSRRARAVKRCLLRPPPFCVRSSSRRVNG